MPTALRELYEGVTRANGWSLRDVERRIDQSGAPGLSKSRINQVISADPLYSVTSDAIRSLAAGLGVSESRVAVAAVQSMGIRLEDRSVTLAEAIAQDPTIADGTKRALLAVLQSAREVRGA